MKQLLLWTNMYPTEKAPYYGTFVRSTEQAWRKVLGERHVSLVAMREKPVGKIAKIYFYTELMTRCVLSLFSKPRGTVLEVHYPVYFLPVLLLLKLLDKKFYLVLRFHGSDLKKVKSSFFFSFLFKILKKEVQIYVVPSDYYVKKIVAELAVPEKQVEKVFPDCVGGSEFLTVTSSRPSDFSDNQYRIGYVSRLEKEKNCEELIRAFYKLGIKNASLTVVGDGSEREYLENLVKQLALESRVTFLGALPRHDLPEVMASFDIFVFPSVSETESFGLVGLEALSCGTPVIANRVLEGAKEYLVHGENGFFYDNNEDGLADALKQYYLMSIEERGEMAVNALRVRDKFSYENVFIKGAEIILSKYSASAVMR
ncbi:glycosyltransferase [Halomonas sp. BMC6]|uniref:glycosyltransferase n=1 Tax=Halomonas sp. BMC6 TaxID=3073244 RepID=UPI0030D338CC